MVVLIIAHLHSFESIPVIGMLQRQYHGTLYFFPVHIILQRNFKGNLYRNATRIREKAVIQILRQPTLELFGKFFCWLMGQTSQHYMSKFLQLCLNCLIEFRVFIAVDHTPPGGHRVNQLLVLGIQINAFRIDDFIG